MNPDKKPIYNLAPDIIGESEIYKRVESLEEKYAAKFEWEGFLKRSGVIDYPQELREHPNKQISETISNISKAFISNTDVQRRFNHEFNSLLIDDSLMALTFLQFSAYIPAQDLDPQKINIPELMSYAHNPKLQKIIGNALTRAQIADQFLTKNRQQAERKPDTGDILPQFPASDDLAILLMKRLFIQEPLIIRSSGNPENGKTVEEADLAEMDEVMTIIRSLRFQEGLIDEARQVSRPEKYIRSRNGKVVHSKGSFKLSKKLEHSFDAKPPFKSNIPFEEALSLSLKAKSLADFRNSVSSKLSTEECRYFQEALDDLAGMIIDGIITGAQTIIIRDSNIDVINQYGQGIRLKRKDGEIDLDLIGFIDTQSVVERDRLAKPQTEEGEAGKDFLYKKTDNA